MYFPTQGWLLALIISTFSSNIRITVSQAPSSGCTSLITNNGNVKFTASTSAVGPGHPVLHGSDVWCAGVINNRQYLKVDLGPTPQAFNRISIQGYPNSTRSISEYHLKTSPDTIPEVYTTIPEADEQNLVGSSSREFWGTISDGSTVATTILDYTAAFSAQYLTSRYLKFNPREPMYLYENHLCLRVDVLICGTAPTPVDGQWTQWSTWTQCPPCGQPDRLTTRSRTCTNPAPAFGGQICIGASSATQNCPDTCATTPSPATTQPPGDGFSQWGQWIECSLSCSSGGVAGTQRRMRTCENANLGCNGNTMETRECNTQACVVTEPPPTPTLNPDSGWGQWGDWNACSQSCFSGGATGTQRRERTCVNLNLECIGDAVETRDCNTHYCEGCGERGPFDDNDYGASTEVQPASWARLNTSNPSANNRAWCADPTDIVGGYVQIDLGQDVQVQVFRVATKGQEVTDQQRWVTSYFISYSPDGLDYSTYQEEGRRRNFSGNIDPSSVNFNDVNISTPVRVIRFHPITYSTQPCMQVSFFGCTVVIPPVIPPDVGEIVGGGKAETGILIALWILAGILSFLLLMACLYYCCWHVCCKRGMKRKGLSAFTQTWNGDTDAYYIEDVDKRWRLPSVDIVNGAVPQNEIQEVTVDMDAEPVKPLGVIQFGIEAEDSNENRRTAETVHSETPTYSDEVGDVKSGASVMDMSSGGEPRYSSIERRKRIKSETAAAILDAGARQSSGFSNAGYIRSQEWLIEPTEPPQVRSRAQELKRSQSADEFATVDYDMFEERPGSAQNAIRGELGRDGYMRMKQTSRGSAADVTDGGVRMGTVDVAIGGVESPDAHQDSSHIYDMAGQEITYTTDNGVYRREQWSAVGEAGPVQLRENGFREVLVDGEPTYSEIHFDDEGNIVCLKN